MIELLVGMIASGKSTYATSRANQGALVIAHDALTQMLHGGVYRYEPGLRDAYQAMQVHLAHVGVMSGRDVIIDRTHLTRESRAIWVDAARTWSIGICAVEFPTFDAETHARRRFEADPRGRSYEDWLGVARHHFEQAMAEPLSFSEGFDGMYVLKFPGLQQRPLQPMVV